MDILGKKKVIKSLITAQRLGTNNTLPKITSVNVVCIMLFTTIKSTFRKTDRPHNIVIIDSASISTILIYLFTNDQCLKTKKYILLGIIRSAIFCSAKFLK